MHDIGCGIAYVMVTVMFCILLSVAGWVTLGACGFSFAVGTVGSYLETREWNHGRNPGK